MPGKLVGNVSLTVRAARLIHQGFAERTECAGVAAQERELHLKTEPEHIIRWHFASELVHRCRVLLDKGDAVATFALRWGQRYFLTPFVNHFLSFIKSAQDHERLACIGVVLSRGDRRMGNRPIEVLQSLFRSALLRVSDPQQIVSRHAAWIRLLVQNQYGSFLFQVARYGRIIKSRGLKILFLREVAIL